MVQIIPYEFVRSREVERFVAAGRGGGPSADHDLCSGIHVRAHGEGDVSCAGAAREQDACTARRNIFSEQVKNMGSIVTYHGEPRT